ncbi:hypothetical protein [Granulicella sp. dw_53]|uniref:hypothetical protein n=1 Tax=Granulicella sp. dw_53 TaxID=2719792 RepID=UPI001BD31D66|nr:hypothetical protein [Granulicella sp. dw_53]
MQTITNNTSNDAALQHVSQRLDAFCADETNFCGNDGFSRKGSLAIVALLSDGLASVTEAAFLQFLKPRLAVLTALGALDETKDGQGATNYRVKRNVDQAAVLEAWKATGATEGWFPDVRPLLKLGAPPSLTNDAIAGLLLIWRDGERSNIA